MTRVFSLGDMRDQLDEIEAEYGEDAAFVIGEAIGENDFEISAADEGSKHPNIGHVGYHSSAFADPGDARALIHSNPTLFGTILVDREYLSEKAVGMLDGDEQQAAECEEAGDD